MRLNKSIIILFGILMSLTLFIVMLKISQSRKQESQTPPETISQIPTTIPIATPTYITPLPSLTPSCIPNENIIGKLPIVTQQYTIEYLPTPKKFFVMISQNPYEKYETEAKKWFISQEIDPNSPCIFWSSVKGVSPKRL